MAYSDKQLMSFLESMGGPDEQKMKMVLYYADLDQNFQGDEEWSDLCDLVVRIDDEMDLSQPFLNTYMEAADSGDERKLYRLMQHDLYDNYVLAAIAMHRMPLPKTLPLVAAAAFNKHSYKGLEDEFAVMRILHWSGFPLSVPEPSSTLTPLHYFASTKYSPGTSPRAVEWLVDHGADVSAQNARGDTPMTYLCAIKGWGAAHTESFMHLLRGGGDPFAASSDGATPYSLLVELNDDEFHEGRANLIAKLEVARGQPRKLARKRSPSRCAFVQE